MEKTESRQTSRALLNVCKKQQCVVEEGGGVGFDPYLQTFCLCAQCEPIPTWSTSQWTLQPTTRIRVRRTFKAVQWLTTTLRSTRALPRPSLHALTVWWCRRRYVVWLTRGSQLVLSAPAAQVDGTNVGVHFEQDWVVVCQKRSGLIGQGEHVQYQRFREWAFDNVEMLWGALGLRYVLFGEWLLARHGVTYNALPSYFLAFDVYDKETASWLSTAAMEALVRCCRHAVVSLLTSTLAQVKPAGIETVPVLSTTWGGSVAELEALVGKSRYSTDQTAEGVYLRFEKDDKVFERLKYRRKTFVAGREDFHKALVTNTLLG